MNKNIELLRLININKEYEEFPGSKVRLINEISFNIEIKNNIPTFTSVLAPFGSGKTTLIKIISGLVSSTSGQILFKGKEIIGGKEIIPFIPAKPSSLPWLTVKEEIDQAIKISGNTGIKSEEIIESIGLSAYSEHTPHNKSRGFRFRISLGRALSVNSGIILLDECFNSMDVITRKEIYNLINEVSNRFGVSFLLTTTNVLEAIELSDNIILLSGKPSEVAGTITIDRQKLATESLRNDYIKEKKIEIENILINNNVINTINFSV